MASESRLPLQTRTIEGIGLAELIAWKGHSKYLAIAAQMLLWVNGMF
jgi:hypothetical protein